MLLWLQRAPHREGWEASSSVLSQAWWILLNRIPRSCPDLQGWVQQPLYPFTVKQKPGSSNCFSCVLGHCLWALFPALPPPHTLRWKNLALQSIKRVDDSAPALQGRGNTAPLLLGEGVHLDPKAASRSITLRLRNSGFSEPGPLLPSPEKKQTQIQAEVGLGISPFAKLSHTADPQALSPEGSQSYMDRQVGSWALLTCLSQHRAFPS